PTRGAAWTVVVEYDGAPPSVAAGRQLAPQFVVEAWPVSSDCAVPTSEGPTDALARHLRAGFDTMYEYWGGGPPRCPTPTPTAVNELLPAASYDLGVLVGDDFPYAADDAGGLIRDTSRVAGFLTGDESDGQLYADDGSPNAEHKAARARRLWSLYPEVTVYNGGMTSGNVGTFAGMADVQGMDAYIAACAPHVTETLFPPLRTAFDYLRNARDNHMPWPTWLYAQGLHGGWNLGSDDAPIHRQPDRQEILVQALSVVAAGGKGVMWFQTSLAEADHDPSRWDAITEANRMIRAVRSWVREGDVLYPAPEVRGGDAIVEAIVGPRAIVVPVINMAASEEVSDVECVRSVISDPGSPPHWVLADQEVGVSVGVPPTSEVRDVFEVLPSGEIVDVDFGVDPVARVVRLPRVSLWNDVPVRLFVLHRGPEGRAEAAAAARLWGEELP
ncbi:MAG: hypothetical protein H6700_03420, partial [Myxococcales bacterium]|nr:hypothetical protein [Myxococcales bacterium]